jgi:hypothetical protein
MNKTYYEIDIRLVLPDKADPETVIRTLGQFYKIDRVAEPIEGDPLLLFIKEIERPKEENKVELVEVGFDVKKGPLDKIVETLT